MGWRTLLPDDVGLLFGSKELCCVGEVHQNWSRYEHQQSFSNQGSLLK